MNTLNKDYLSFSKIRTSVPGFDDLFYGGLRLPNNEQKDGICMVIYGERGVSKSDLALQIMRGVNRFFKTDANSIIDPLPRFCSLTHRESELEKHYRGAAVVDMMDVIKAPEEQIWNESSCRLCSCFRDLGDVWSSLPVKSDGIKGCECDDIEKCIVCKLIRHGVIVYNSRSQSLHWNVGSVSDEENLLSQMTDEAISTSGIFKKPSTKAAREFYEKTPLQELNDIREEVYEVVRNMEAGDAMRKGSMKRSACVIEGFNAFDDDDLKRLPYADLIRLLRKLYAVSILVFDKRGGDLHLNVDIIIHMRNRIDPNTFYQYQEMHVVKSDCQPHVRGWHKYRTVYGMKIVVYPNIPFLLKSRFETDDAAVRLEHESLLYPQSLLQRLQADFSRESEENDIKGRALQVLKDVFWARRDEGNPYDENNSNVSVVLVDSKNDYDHLYNQFHNQVSNGDTTLAAFLFGKTEQEFRKAIAEWNCSSSSLRSIHCWEVSSSFIWPEVFASVVRQYIMRWKLFSQHQHLHIVIDDFANIGLYPLMNNEPLLPYALVTICRNLTSSIVSIGDNRKVKITLSIVCSSKESPYYNSLYQLIKR